MKPVKYSTKDTKKTNFGSKIIYKYPTPTKNADIGHMLVNGRHPKNARSFMMNQVCSFVIFITKGTGTIYAGDEIFNVKPEDVVFIPAKNKYAVEGNFEYVTVDFPSWYPEQYSEVQI